MPKLATKNANHQFINISRFDGGVNYLVPADELALNEAQILENFEFDSHTGMLVSSGGLREVYSFTDNIETLFIDDNGQCFFSSDKKLYKTNLSTLLNTWNLSGIKTPSYVRFGKKIAVCSGGSIQYYDKQKPSKGLQKVTDKNAPKADHAFVKNGRFIAYSADNDYLNHSGVGDITNWHFASDSGISNPTKIKLTAVTEGSLTTAYHVDKIELTSTATSAGTATLTVSDGTTYSVTVAKGDAASTIAKKIVEANEYKGWTVTAENNIVTFTANKRGKRDQVVYDYGTTGALGTVNQITEGSGVYVYKISAVKNTATDDSDPVYAATIASETQTIILTADGGVKLDWTAIDGAVKYKVYGRIDEEFSLLTTVTGTTWIDDGTAYNLGTAAPTVNNTAYTHITSDAAKVDIGWQDSGCITAAVALSSDIVIFKSNGKVFRLAGNYPNQEIYPITDSVYCQNKHCTVQSGNNAYFYGQYGFKDLGTVVEYGSIKAGDIGSKIDKIASCDSAARLWYLPGLRQIWIKPDNSGKVYVYNLAYNAFSVRKFNAAINDVFVHQNVVYIAKGTKIYALNPYGDKEDGNNVVSTFKSKRFTNTLPVLIKRIAIELYCLKNGQITVTVGKFNETFDTTANSSIVNQNTETIYNNTRSIWVDSLNRIEKLTNFTERDFDITVTVNRGLAKIRNITLEVAEI